MARDQSRRGVLVFRRVYKRSYPRAMDDRARNKSRAIGGEFDSPNFLADEILGLPTGQPQVRFPTLELLLLILMMFRPRPVAPVHYGGRNTPFPWGKKNTFHCVNLKFLLMPYS